MTRSIASTYGRAALVAFAAFTAFAARGEDALEIVRFAAPAGWRAADQAGAQVARAFTSPDSGTTDQAVILVLVSPAKDGMDLWADFFAITRQLAQDGKVAEQSQVASAKTGRTSTRCRRPS